jgi:AbrB family looped-hinge helix DNA binding protein
MTEVTVTSKGQVTIPADLRRKFKIEEGSKVEILEEDGRIVVKRKISIFDLAGSSAGSSDVEELKRLLDGLRDEDAEKEPL